MLHSTWTKTTSSGAVSVCGGLTENDHKAVVGSLARIEKWTLCPPSTNCATHPVLDHATCLSEYQRKAQNGETRTYWQHPDAWARSMRSMRAPNSGAATKAFTMFSCTASSPNRSIIESSMKGISNVMVLRLDDTFPPRIFRLDHTWILKTFRCRVERACLCSNISICHMRNSSRYFVTG